MLYAYCIIFLAFVCLYEPLWGYRAFQQFQLLLSIDPGARLQFYKSVIAGLWMLTGVLGIALATGLISPAQTGLVLPSIKPDLLSEITTILVLVAATVYFITLLYQWGMLAFHKTYRTKVNQQPIPKTVKSLLPVTGKEKKIWLYVSLTAGITEEFIYRGVLLFALAFLFPHAPVWLTVLSASMLFGMGHRYQGWGGIFKTALGGLFFCLLYLATGSILPGMILHFLQDYIARYIDPVSQ